MADSVTVHWNGEDLPVTNLYDEDFEEVDTWAAARSFMAGPMSDGCWIGGVTADFRPLPTH